MKKVLSLLTLLLAVCSGAWAADVIIYSMTSKTAPTSVAVGATDPITATFVGGTAEFHNGHASNAASMNGNQVNLAGSGGSWFHAVLTSATISEGDVITLAEPNATDFYINSTTSKPSSTVTVPYTVPSGSSLIGKSDIYIWKGSSGKTFTGITITHTLTVPSITTQPVSAVYQTGAAATALSVVAEASAGELSYQWYSCVDADKTNPVAIDGATSDSYTPSTDVAATSYYFCRVTDSNGYTDSDVATITVSAAAAPTISVVASANPVFQNVAVTLTATADGVPTPTIQWYSCDDAEKTNAVAIDGETGLTYTPSTATAGTYYYYAVATNSVDAVASNVIALTVNALFAVTYSVGSETGVTGTVPEAVEVEASVTLPKNQTLYKEGYTLTAWNDGTTTYDPGANATITANTTMTAVFSANTGELGVCPATVTWQFQTGQGAPTWSHEGDAAYVYVAQMPLGGETIDMPLTMDASDGKIANANWTDWTQMNGGTKLTVPVLKGAVLKLYVYGEGTSKTTFEGNTGAYASNIYTYTATTTGDLEIVIGDESYFQYLTVTYPMSGIMLYDFASSVGTGVSGNSDQVSSADQTVNGASVNVVKFSSSLNNSDHITYYWKITPATGIFKKGDRISWTGCYSNSSTRETTIAIYDNDAISSAIVTGESFGNVYGGSALSPKALTTGYFTLTADAEALYIGRSGGTGTYLTALTVVREEESVKIAASGKSTFCSNVALDLAKVPAGLTAYKVSEVNSSSVTLEAVTEPVAAGTGLILIGDPGETYELPIATAGTDISETNKLVGVVKATELVADQAYVLSSGKLVRAAAGTLPAGKAYLPAALVTGGARELSFFFEGETTGINAVENTEEINGIYNLAGQRVAQPTRGLYIVNGKKVVIK